MAEAAGENGEENVGENGGENAGEYRFEEAENEGENEEARMNAEAEANSKLRANIIKQKETRAKEIANRSPTCAGIPQIVTQLEKLQLVIVVAIRPTETKEYDWVQGVSKFLRKSRVPFTSIHIYFAFYNSSHAEHDLILEFKRESFLADLPQIADIHVHIYNETPWGKNDILNTIRDSEDSTYLVLFGHGAHKEDGTEIELTYEPAATGLKLRTMKGTDLISLSSGFPAGKHLVVLTTACYASNFLNESIIPPNIHYVFQGESGVCIPNTAVQLEEYNRLLRFCYPWGGFIPLIVGIDYHNAKNPKFKIDIHSCNSLVKFKGPFEGGRRRRHRRQTLKKKKTKSKRKSRAARRYY